MDYRIFKKVQVMVLTGLFLFYGCTGARKDNSSNTYYIELINFDDSLRNLISGNIKGKISFLKDDKPQIISLNYVAEEYPQMHYFKPVTEIENPIKPGSQKIRIEFDGKYSIDSIKYFIKKFSYKDQQWIKISDMGYIKGFSSYKRSDELAKKEYADQIFWHLASYTYE